MLRNELYERPERHPVINLLLILAIVAIGFGVVGLYAGMFIALQFYDGTLNDMLAVFQNPEGHPEIKIPMYLVQGASTLIGLIVLPALFISLDKTPNSLFFKYKKVELFPIVATVLIVIVFMGVNSVFIEWNSKLDLPAFLDGFERHARNLEDRAEKLTTLLTQFSYAWEFLIAMIVIAVLPAIGEELVFRGLIQNELFKGTKNIHVSIWFAAFLFSAIHFQLFGFVPRLLLGALFGYLYYWSGNLLLPILAHFVNNGFQLLVLYLNQKGAVEIDMETPEAFPIYIVILATLLTAGLLYYFYKHFEHRKPSLPSL